MTELSDTFIRALPDLTVVVRRDGLIMSNLGGRELGVPTQPGALCGKRLQDVWPASVATELGRLARRALKGRSQADGHFHHESVRIDVRARPQGVDRVLMVMRALPEAAKAVPEATVAAALGGGDPGDCALFARKFCEAIAQAKLRETHVALAIIHFDDLPGISNACGAVLGQMLAIAAVERVSTLNLSSLPRRGRPLRATQLESHQVAVLIDDVPGSEAAERAAQEIRRALAAPITLDGRRYELSPTIGLALFPADGHEPETLLDRARGAILEAQRSGTEDVVNICANTAAAESVSRADLERELSWAVEREQFSLGYAPVLELKGRRTALVTASLSWTHSMCGPVAPERFMPLLDTLELRQQLDVWTLRRGFRDLALLSQGGNTRVGLAVKLTRKSMEAPSLLEHVAAAAAAADVALARLYIDVDARTLASGSAVRSRLRELRNLGARVFLDNFGQDGIALSRLSSLPLDGVKVAAELVARLETDAGARAACGSAVSIAHAFGLKCIAAGVARRAELDYLYECGCELATGPLLGIPKSVHELRQVPERGSVTAGLSIPLDGSGEAWVA
jgi:predicted signal transduction protein with EAL and GGDEF domain